MLQLGNRAFLCGQSGRPEQSTTRSAPTLSTFKHMLKTHLFSSNVTVPYKLSLYPYHYHYHHHPHQWLAGIQRHFQNAAARFISGARRSDHITPVLRQLHWLPVRQRVQYKLILLVYKSLRGLTPLYLSEECQLATVGGRRELRSADVITCHISRIQTKLGDRAFQVAGPRL